MLASKYADPGAVSSGLSTRKRSRPSNSFISTRETVVPKMDFAEPTPSTKDTTVKDLRLSKPLPPAPAGESFRWADEDMDDNTNIDDLKPISTTGADVSPPDPPQDTLPRKQNPKVEPVPEPLVKSLEPPETSKIISTVPPADTLDPNIGSKSQDLPKTPSPDLVAAAAVTKPAAAGKRLRSKKGKACTIRIPENVGRTYSGYRIPMSQEELQIRVQSFEKDGYDVRGYTLGSVVSDDEAAVEGVQGRSIFTESDDFKSSPGQDKVTISIPDKKEWNDYVNFLREEKLRKLGVSFGEEPPLPPSQLPVQPVLSRSNTSPYPPLPFSPPIPASSVGSQQGWQSFMPFSAPFSPAASTNNTSIGQIMSPGPQFGQSIVGNIGRQSPFNFSFPANPTPSMQRAFSPQQQLFQQGLQRADSPGITQSLGGQTPNLVFPTSSRPAFNVNESQDGEAGSKNENSVDWNRLGQKRLQTPDNENGDEAKRNGKLELPQTTPDRNSTHFGELASPKPQGHRHNVSQHLEREAENAQYYPGEYVNGVLPFRSGGLAGDGQFSAPDGKIAGHQSVPSQASIASSQFNAAAKEFVFNPQRSVPDSAPVSKEAFLPTAPMKIAKAADATSTVSLATAHSHSHQGSVNLSNFNVAAPEFKPPAQSGFAFSSSWFNFSKKPDNTSVMIGSQTDGTPAKQSSIFGNLADIIKPSKKSKAIAIVKPEESDDAEDNEDISDQEDESGRPMQSTSKIKKGRFNSAAGDEIPRFAEPTPEPQLAPSPVSSQQHETEVPVGDQSISEIEVKSPPLERVTEPSEETQFKPRPLKIEYDLDISGNESEESAMPWHGIEGEQDKIQQNQISEIDSRRSLAASPAASSGIEEASRKRSQAPSPTKSEQLRPLPYPEHNLEEEDPLLYPSMKDADDLTEYINNDNSDFGVEKSGQFRRNATPDRRSQRSASLAAEPPTEKRDLISFDPESPSIGIGERDMEDFVGRFSRNQDRSRPSASPVRRLNKMAEAPVSDWDDMLSSGEELNIPQQHYLNDSHIVAIVEGLLMRHLGPFERSLQEIRNSVNHRQTNSKDIRRAASPYDKSNSDADDEDEAIEEPQRLRRDQKADRRIDQIRQAVVDAMQSTQTNGLSQIEQEVKFRQIAEQRADDAQRLVAISEKQIALYKESTKEADEKLSAVEDERDDALRRYNIVEEELRSKTLDFTAETAALENTLDEYRASQAKWQEELLSIKESREGLQRTIDSLKQQISASSDDIESLTVENLALQERLTSQESLLEAMDLLKQQSLESSQKAEELSAANSDLTSRLVIQEDLQKTTALLEQQAAESQQHVTDLVAEVSSLKEQLAVRNVNSESVESLERQASEQSQQIENLTVENSAIREQLNVMTGEHQAERSNWSEQDSKKASTLQALQEKLDLSTESAQKFRAEIERLSSKEQDAIRAEVRLEETQNAKSYLEEKVKKLTDQAIEHQTIVARYEREASEAHENTAIEVQRTKTLLELDVELANKRVENVRADLETRLQMAKSELENVRKDHDSVRARYEMYLNESIAGRKEAVQEVNKSHAVKIQQERERFDSALKDLSEQHDRAISNAHEDRRRSEEYLEAKLKLSNDKCFDFEERVAHLEQRLAVAQSAAQAAASAAQAAKSANADNLSSGSASATHSITTPRHLEKVSPQALRESIVVLQEQLQDREARIEQLESRRISSEDNPAAKLQEREAEVVWLREILNVRHDDLTDLANNLQLERFDRNAARNAAIRIKANLQMVQHERDRKIVDAKPASPANSSASILNDFQNFASPKANQLASAFSNWRKNPPSLAEMRQRQAAANGTPSRPSTTRPTPSRVGSNSSSSTAGSRPTMTNPMAAAAMSNASKQQSDAQTFLSGLMTPPTSNLRRTPSATASGAKTARPQTPSRSLSRRGAADLQSNSPENDAGASTSPLMRKGDYDLDAELGHESLDFDDEEESSDAAPKVKLPAKSSPSKKNDKTEETAEKTKLEPLGGVVSAE